MKKSATPWCIVGAMAAVSLFQLAVAAPGLGPSALLWLWRGLGSAVLRHVQHLHDATHPLLRRAPAGLLQPTDPADLRL
ncbi:MAG: hypothetical protein R3C10_15670 [Pirellulales bacterium]